jgi:glycosyltransferase involved in cell wall biosynthesis
MNYLLVTHIGFSRSPDGSVTVDALWGQDLRGLAGAVGQVTVAAPQLPPGRELKGWGPGTDRLEPSDGIRFVGLPLQRRIQNPFTVLRTRAILQREAASADLVHCSNLFIPHLGLYHAFDEAARMGKKTLFVVAEDFPDMLGWEWVRTAPSPLQRWRRQRMLQQMDQAVRDRVARASLTFLHTPAAVHQYRMDARNAVAIRQPGHEAEHVISPQALQEKIHTSREGLPLRLSTASRLSGLKGIDFAIRAVDVLARRGVRCELSIAGDGPEREALKTLAVRLGVQQSVRFLGPITPGAAMRSLLAQSHILLMPHLTTDFGRAFFDAMSAASPVIAFRSIASQDTVRDGVDGLIAPNADFEALADAIGRCHRDRAWLHRAMHQARDRALTNTRSAWMEIRYRMIRELMEDNPALPTSAPAHAERIA